MTESSALAGESHDGRHASWLELFFDLVFVAAAAQLSHQLHGDPGPGAFVAFLCLFFPAWWAWINITVYSNLFDNDGVRARVLMLAGMLALAAISVAIPEGLAGRAPVYALGFAGTRVVLFLLWWPATRSAGTPVARWRPLTYCLLSGLLWAVSAIVPSPWRFALWALALLVEIGLVLLAGDTLLFARFDITHLVERVGLFVIIVLGESVISLVTAVDHAWSPAAAMVALLGFVLLAALWWSYFDFGSSSVERALSASHGRSSFALIRDVVAFLHFFAVASIIVLAAGLGTAVDDASHGHLPLGAVWALAGGQAAYHATHAVIALRYRRPAREVAVWAAPGVAVPLAVIALHGVLPPVAAVAVLAAEAIAHLVYARRAAARRVVAG
ncbi:low temperature requirement protein A [Solihabitans fulvus]|nr:low temperature requirement protein A [Solihabitans fulvus]